MLVGPEDACELAYHWNRAGRVSRGDDYLAMAESYAGGESSYGIETDESDLSEVTVTLSLAADKEELARRRPHEPDASPGCSDDGNTFVFTVTIQ